MKKLSQKSVLLFGVVLAVCAFVGPSMASAASWSGLGTHQLFSPNLSFITGAPNFIGWSCAQSTFDTVVTNGADAAVIGSRFSNCRGLPGAAGSCTLTPTGSRFPWTATATATATDNIQIHNMHVNLAFEALPGTAASECLTFGLQITLTGTLTGGSWNPTSKEIAFTNAHGLAGHANSGGVLGLALTGTIRDIANTLNVIM
ncbi:MAG TPA: hypothetical protein VFY45_12010 [Baekduia sp.]|nr:hypothetical protein [Baekduia sp.]